MLDWLRKVLGRYDDDEESHWPSSADAVDVEQDGELITFRKHLGSLKIRSGVLAYGEPHTLPATTGLNIESNEVSISARFWEFPSGTTKACELILEMDNGESPARTQETYLFGTDAGSIVIADKADIDEHWIEVGKERVGIINTARDTTLLRDLKKRFKLRTVQEEPLQAEVVGPVSERLEKEIEQYLLSIPAYSFFPYMFFHVQTNNSIDRVFNMGKPCAFLPIGNDDLPVMFACRTGHGPGTYEIRCLYDGNALRTVIFDFAESKD